MLSGWRTVLYFIIGLLILVLGMVSEFLISYLLPSSLIQLAYYDGVFLAFFILLFAAGVYILRRSILGIWRSRYDSLVYSISALLCVIITIETVLNIQAGHPYLELAAINPTLMIFLWAFVFPPLNPLSGILMEIFLLGVSLINWVVPVNHSKPIEVTPKAEEH
ncbi:MAG: hypothetical protein ACFFDP_06565, partial [Promethearchaeota archaeon]